MDKSHEEESESSATEPDELHGGDLIGFRITAERQEVQELLQTPKNDTRVERFLAMFEANYKEFMKINSNRITMRFKVRQLKAQIDVSSAKNMAVQDIYSGSDEHIAALRREVNIVYHQLIEMQDQEDAAKVENANLVKAIKDMNEQIREREMGAPGQNLRLAEKLEGWYDETRDERNRVVRGVDQLKENFLDASNKQTQLENKVVSLEEKIAETNREFIRVGSNISREQEKRAKVQASLHAANDQLTARAKDMVDLRHCVEVSTEECKALAETARGIQINVEKAKMDIKSVNGKIRAKKFVYDQQMDAVREIEAEIETRMPDYKKRKHETEHLKEQTTIVSMLCKEIKRKATEIEGKKHKIIEKKEKGRKVNTGLYEEIAETKRNFELAILEQTSFLKQRDFLRKKMMKEKNSMQKDEQMRALHTLANKRLTQDNAHLVADGEDQKAIMRKLDQEKEGYVKQALNTMRKTCKVADDSRKCMEKLFWVMRLISDEEMKMLESQNMYESTRNEHVILTRHILQLRDLLTRLDTKAKAMTYEAQKLVQERDYRDDAIFRETLALQKANRQVFVLKVNLKDLKESNVRTRLIIENQDLEEKKLLKITRVMKSEQSREVKGLERVIRDVDSLSLALTRRQHELQDLFKMVKLKQSLLEKGENMYNIRWKEHKAVTVNLDHTRALRRLDRKRRNIVNYLLDTVKFLHQELEAVQLRNKGLQEELSHPRNIHRWRNLLGRDPESYESVCSIRQLRRQIQEKVALTTESMDQIHLLDREYLGFTTRILMQPSPETVLQLKLYKDDLSTRYVQLKRLVAELTVAKDEKIEGQEHYRFLKIKMKKLREKWLKRMEKERKRVANERLNVLGPLSMLLGPKGLPQIRAEDRKIPPSVPRTTPDNP